MSGGEPSSIKRYVSCAAASLHTYVSDFFIYLGVLTLKNSFWQGLRRSFEKASPAGLLTAFAVSVMLISAGAAENDVSLISAGAVLILTGAAVMLLSTVTVILHGPAEDITSDYDREVIGRAFGFGAKRRLFYKAFEHFRNEENEDALDDFRDLLQKDLTDKEKGVLAFYTAICYNRMGFSTNAAHQAVIAADNGVQTAESLLMAARSFNMSASYGSAAEIYERLLPIAEERGIFPFLFNEMGKLYLSANEPEKSRTYFEKAVEYGLDPVTAQGGLALVSLLEGKEDEACERYRLALIARINDTDGYRDYCAQICTANGYPENFFEEHLKARFHRA